MKKRGNKRKKQTDGIFYLSSLTASVPQMKISGNENSFSSFPQRYNRGNDCSFP